MDSVTEHRPAGELKKFRETLEQIRSECLAQYMKKMDTVGYELAGLVTDSIIQKIATIPAVRIKQDGQHDNARILGEMLNQLFNPNTKTTNLKIRKS